MPDIGREFKRIQMQLFFDLPQHRNHDAVHP